MIPDWRTNCVYLSSRSRRHYPAIWASLEYGLMQSGTVVAAIPKTKDIWCRDYMG